MKEAFNARDWLAPRYWPDWLLVGFMWLLSRLPFDAALAFGRALGSLLYWLLGSRRRITLRNLELAFPDHDLAWRQNTARSVFRGLGMSIAETAWCWFRDLAAIDDRFILEGREHLEQALEGEPGVIVLQAHFSCMELAGAWIGPRFPIAAVYDKPKNPFVAALLLAKRSRHITLLIDNQNIRAMARRLKQGGAVWYSPDQSVAARHGGIESRFFEQTVMSSSGTARLATIAAATVIPMLPLRTEAGRYRFIFGAPLDLNWRDVEDATNAVNAVFESQARSWPDQYFWVHKRFKPPKGWPSPYDNDALN